MTSPQKTSVQSVTLAVTCDIVGPHHMVSAVACHLPGVSPHYRYFSCDPSDVQEASAFYDDTQNEIRVWARLLLEAVHDVALGPATF